MIEIERKFIVDKEKWNSFKNSFSPWGTSIIQGYFPGVEGFAQRVRIKEDKAFLTIKEKAQGVSRHEFEYEIPIGDAHEMMELFCGSRVISKKRYVAKIDGKEWEVDEFEGRYTGLIIAELELDNKEESFVKPEWCLKEVTEFKEFYNEYLSSHSESDFFVFYDKILKA